jgi:two-component system, LytTR family, sensor histidine kinase AlgZ
MTLNSHKNFLPNFCTLTMMVRLFFITELLALLLTLAAGNTEMGFLLEFVLRSLFSLWITFISIAVLCSLKKYLEPLSHALAGFIAFIVIQVIGLLLTIAMMFFLTTTTPLMSLIGTETQFVFYARTLSLCALVSMAFLRYLYIQFQWQQQMEAKAAVKLNALQARMRPHFLFNSLNSIASLTRINPPLAETLIEDLAELMRASMTIDDVLLIPIAQELHLVQLYLSIEQQRLDERLHVVWQLETVPKDALIPPLSLQPLIENAVYYGIEPNPEGGEIVVTGSMHAHQILITVTNPQTLQKSHSRPSNHIALKNLTARLKGCFEGKGHLRIVSNEIIYQVTLEIPYKK